MMISAVSVLLCSIFDFEWHDTRVPRYWQWLASFKKKREVLK